MMSGAKLKFLLSWPKLKQLICH